jgi:endonuclease/exonuclease/phosphatase family metal-dependent hydrolase
MQQFKVASLNVHAWKDEQDMSNSDHILELFRPLQLDLIAMEEVQHDDYNQDIIKLATELSMHYKFSESYWRGEGNAFLSKHPIKHFKHYMAKLKNRDSRSIVQIEIESKFSNENDASFYVLHIDHILEDTRVKQLELMHEELLRKDDKDVQIILGDFNALCLEDYTPSYLKNINQERKYGSWERAYGDVYNWMKNHGYVDLYRQTDKESKDDQISTCRFGTRIDYIWMKGDLKNGWRFSKCEIISSKKATDHNMVVATFEKPQ